MAFFFFLAPKKKVGCEKKSGAFGATMAAPKLMRSDTKGSRLSLSSAASNIDVSEIGAPWALEKPHFFGGVVENLGREICPEMLFLK